jgi:lysophospholipase L1-like esterase
MHITAPLTIVQRGIKGNLKKMIGRTPSGAIENIRREEYNELLRQTYRGREPLFDLARVESTAPDGTAVTGEWKGKVAPEMAPAYTDDGGHLNAAGRLRAARELVSILASIPSRPAAGGLSR